MQDNIKDLYSALTADGEDFGTEQQFRETYKSPDNLRQLYQVLSADGEDFGTEDDFVKTYSPEPEPSKGMIASASEQAPKPTPVDNTFAIPQTDIPYVPQQPLVDKEDKTAPHDWRTELMVGAERIKQGARNASTLPKVTAPTTKDFQTGRAVSTFGGGAQWIDEQGNVRKVAGGDVFNPIQNEAAQNAENAELPQKVHDIATDTEAEKLRTEVRPEQQKDMRQLADWLYTDNGIGDRLNNAVEEANRQLHEELKGEYLSSLAPELAADPKLKDEKYLEEELAHYTQSDKTKATALQQRYGEHLYNALNKILSDDKLKQTIQDASDAMGISAEAYIKAFLVPKIENEFEPIIDNAILKRYTPKNAITYITSGIKEWLPALLVRSFTEDPKTMEYERRGNEEFAKNANWATKFGKEAVAFADPTFHGAFKLGGLTSKGLRKAASAVTTSEYAGLSSYAAGFGNTAEKTMQRLLGAQGGKTIGQRAGKFAENWLKTLPEEALGQGLGMKYYGTAKTALQTYGETGDPLQAGVAAWEAAHDTSDMLAGASFAVTMPWLHGGWDVLGAGWKKGASKLAKGAWMAGKTGYDAMAIAATAGVMWTTDNIGKYLQGVDMDWSLNAYIHETAMAAAMKINPSLIKHFNHLAEQAKTYGSNYSESQLGKWQESVRLTEDEIKEICEATNTTTLPEALETIFPDSMRGQGGLSEKEVSKAQTRFVKLMNKLSWDTQNKLAIGLTGSMTLERPRCEYFREGKDKDGNKIVYELDKDRNVLSRKVFSTEEEKQAFIRERGLDAYNQDFWKLYNEAVERDKELAEQTIETVCANNNRTREELDNILKKAPSKRTDLEWDMIEQIMSELDTEIKVQDAEAQQPQAPTAGNGLTTEAQRNESGITTLQTAPRTDSYTRGKAAVETGDLASVDAIRDERALAQRRVKEVVPADNPVAGTIKTMLDEGLHEDAHALVDATAMPEQEALALHQLIDADAAVDGANDAIKQEIEAQQAQAAQKANAISSEQKTIIFVTLRDSNKKAFVIKGIPDWKNNSTVMIRELDENNNPVGKPHEVKSRDEIKKISPEVKTADYIAAENDRIQKEVEAKYDPMAIGKKVVVKDGEDLSEYTITAHNEDGTIHIENQYYKSDLTRKQLAEDINEAKEATYNNILEAERKQLEAQKAAQAEADLKRNESEGKAEEEQTENGSKKQSLEEAIDYSVKENGHLLPRHYDSKTNTIGDFLTEQETDNFVRMLSIVLTKNPNISKEQLYNFLRSALKSNLKVNELTHFYKAVDAYREGRISLNDVLSLFTDRLPQVETSEPEAKKQVDIPEDETGEKNHIADGVSPEDAVYDIYNNGAFTKEEADDYVNDGIERTQKAYNAVNKPISRKKNEGMNAYAERKAKHEAEVAQAKQALDRWLAIKEEAQRQEQTAIEAERARVEAERKAAEQKRLETEQKMKAQAEAMGTDEPVAHNLRAVSKGGLVIDELSAEISSEEATTLDKIGRALGVEVRIISEEGEAAPNGQWSPGKGKNGLNLITINKKANEKHSFLYGHEMTHEIKDATRDNPDLWKAFVQAVRKAYGEEAFDKEAEKTLAKYNKFVKEWNEEQRIINKDHKDRAPYTLDEAIEEVCCDVVGRNIISDEQFAKRLLDEVEKSGESSASIAQRIRDFIQKMLNAMREIVNPTDAQARHIEDLERAKKMWGDLYELAAAKERERREAIEEADRQRKQEEMLKKQEARKRSAEAYDRPVKQARERMAGDEEALAVLEDKNREPRTLKEAIAENIPAHSLVLKNWTDANGVQHLGLEGELGYKYSDLSRLTTFIGSRENGAMDITTLAERIYENLPEELKILAPDGSQDVRNAIIELFSEAETADDIIHYTDNARIREAEAIYQSNRDREDAYAQHEGTETKDETAPTWDASEDPLGGEVEPKFAVINVNNKKKVRKYQKSLSTEDHEFSEEETERIIEANNRFNTELRDPNNGDSHIFKLGKTGSLLQRIGFPDLEIEMSGRVIGSKAQATYKKNHPFEKGEVADLVFAINSPMASFKSTSEPNSKVLLLDIKHEGNNFIAAVQLDYATNINGRLKVNRISGLYPKDKVQSIVDWINAGNLLEYVNKNKVLNWLVQQQSNPADVRNQIKNLDSAANLVRNHDNSKTFKEYSQQKEENSQNLPSEGDKFSITIEHTDPFYSNAAKAVTDIKQEKATGEQWLKMIEKNGGLKKEEDKWMGLSDWLKDKKSVTKAEVAKFIADNSVKVEDVEYAEVQDIGNNPKFRQYNEEYQEIIDNADKYYDEADAEYAKFMQKMQDKYGEDWANEMDERERKLEDRLIEARDRFMNYDSGSIREIAYEVMCERYGDDFRDAFDVDAGGLIPSMDWDGNLTGQAKSFLEFDQEPINSTRLQYTTDGLENKREIALTVPTIEPYYTDEIHFGDAGEGRAVAWIRFGETTIDAPATNLDKSLYTAKKNKNGGFDVFRPNGSEWGRIDTKSADQAIEEAYNDDILRNRTTQRVLVIDEIQSKRHQDAREHGYAATDAEVEQAKKKLDDAWDAIKAMDNKMVEEGKTPKSLSEEEKAEYMRLQKDWEDAGVEFAKKQKSKYENVPDAPFRKTWHELAMKRMLRYAAENGYDKIAWTTGTQQAERYNLGEKIKSIAVVPNENGTRRIDLNFRNDESYEDFYQMFVDNDGIITDGDYKGQLLSDIVGKDLAIKMMGAKERIDFRDANLRVGGEGMKGFYDRMLPMFMDKYGKKWGVKTQDVELDLPNEADRVMHSVDVTPEMKESVSQGQPMFSLSDKEKTLMGVHNISEDKLRKALKFGGLANPSLAVIDTNKGSHTRYGEISLIPKSSLIDARTGENAGTYLGDAWTPTYPGVHRFFTDKGQAHKMAIAREAAGGDEKMAYQFADRIQQFMEGNSDRLHFLFLKQKGLEPELKYPRTTHSHEEYEEIQKIFGEGTNGMPHKYEITDEQNKALLDILLRNRREICEITWSGVEDEKLRKDFVDADVERYKKEITDENGKVYFGVGEDYIYGVWKDERRRKNSEIDWYGTDLNAREEVNKQGLSEEYNQWKEKLLADEDVEEKLFAGWTPSGYKRYLPNTVENASKLMNKESQTNAYDQNGLGATKSALLKRVQTLDEIRKNKGKLQDEETFNEKMQEASDELFDIIHHLSGMQKISDNPFSNNDYAEHRLQEAFVKRNPVKYLNDEYGYDIDEKGEYAQQIKDFIKSVDKLPAKYFETKFRRPVGLSEFAIAVVPEKTSKYVIEGLQKAGLDVRTYDGTEEGRKAVTMDAVNAREDIKFSIPPRKDAEGNIEFSYENDPKFSIRVFHGSGADFKKFDHKFMGTGEGNQAFGWGTYVSEVEGVGRSYAELNTDMKESERKYIESRIEEARKYNIPASVEYWENELKSKKLEGSQRHLYEVEIPDDNGKNYLDWEKEPGRRILSKVAKLMDEKGIGFPTWMPSHIKDMDTTNKLYWAIHNISTSGKGTGGDLYSVLDFCIGSQEEASKFLQELGYTGIKVSVNYAGTGKRNDAKNYVIFDENDAKIVNNTKFSIPKKQRDDLSIKKGDTFEDVLRKAQAMKDEARREDIERRIAENQIQQGDTYEDVLRKAGKLRKAAKEQDEMQSKFSVNREKQIKSKQFKDWFGDWEKDPENASKVVDENGEPMVMYHGSDKKRDVFKMQEGAMGKGAYFTSVFEEACDYVRDKLGRPDMTDDEIDAGGYVTEVYLNIRDGKNITASKYGDGIIAMATSPEQIKSATDNNGNFDRSNPDVRFSFATQMRQRKNESTEDFIQRQQDYINLAVKSPEQARQRVVDEIKYRLDDKSLDEMGKKALTTLLNAVRDATDKNLPEVVKKVNRTVNELADKALTRQMQKLLNTKTVKRNTRNMSVAGRVDDTVAQAFDFMKGKLVEVDMTEYDAEKKRINASIYECNVKGRDLERQLADTTDPAEQDRIAREIAENAELKDQLKAELKGVQEDIDKAKQDNVQVTTESIKKIIDDLQEKFDKMIEGEGEYTDYDAAKQMACEILNKKLRLSEYAADAANKQAEIAQLEAERAEARKAKDKTTAKSLALEIKARQDALDDIQLQTVSIKQEIVNDLKAMIEGGRNNLAEKELKKQNHKSELILGCYGDLAEGKLPRVSQQEEKENAKELTGIIGTTRNIVRGTVGSFEYLMRHLPKTTLGEDSFMYKYFIQSENGIMAAQENYMKGMFETLSAFDKKTSEIFNKDYKDVVRENEEHIKDHGVTIPMEVNGIETRVPCDLVNTDGSLSKGQATYAYMVWKMPDGRVKLEAMGFDEQSMREIKEFIGEDNVKWADWIQDEFLPKLREKYNERYVEIYNTSMAKIANYVPLKIFKEDVREKVDVENPQTQEMKSLDQKAGSLINRTYNLNKVDLLNSAYEVITKHIDEMEEWYHMARIRQDLNYVLRSKAIKKALNANERASWGRLEKAARIATGGYKDQVSDASKWVSAITTGLAGANIAWRNTTALKQMLSLPAFFGYSQDPKFIGALLKNAGIQYSLMMPTFLATAGTMGYAGRRAMDRAASAEENDKFTRLALSDTMRWCIENVPSFRHRVAKGSVGNVILDELLSGEKTKWDRFKAKLGQYGMAANGLVDAVTCAIGIKTIYDYRYKQLSDAAKKDYANGLLTEEEYNQKIVEADRLARTDADIYYNGTQQSTHPAFLAPIQVNKDVMSKAYTLYKNSPQSYARKTLLAAQDLWKICTKWDKLQQNYAKQYMEEDETLTEAQAMNKANAHLRNIAYGSAFGMALFGWFMGWSWLKGGQGFLGMHPGSNSIQGFFGLEEEDEEEEEKKSALVKAGEMLNPVLNSVPVWDFVVNTAAGQDMEPLLLYDVQQRLARLAKGVNGEASEGLAYDIINNVARIGLGIDLTTVENIYLGMDNLVRDGFSTENRHDMITLMYLLNTPNSNRREVARQLYSQYENPEEFVNTVLLAEKAMRKNEYEESWKRYVPGFKGVDDKRVKEILKDYWAYRASDEEREMARKKKENTAKALDEKYTSTEELRKAYDAEEDPTIKKRMGDVLKKRDSGKGNGKGMPINVLAEKVWDDTYFDKASKAAENDIYLQMSNANDAAEDTHIQQRIKHLKPFWDELKKIEDDAQSREYEQKYAKEIDEYATLSSIQRKVNSLKGKLKKVTDQKDRDEIMQALREVRSEALTYHPEK